MKVGKILNSLKNKKMIGSTFEAISGGTTEWVVIGSHGMFTDTWKCYPVDKVKSGEIKESLIQYFSTDFIKEKEIFDDKVYMH